MRFLSVFVITLGLLAASPGFSQDTESEPTTPVEIVVTGKQPGPPLWRVKNGGNTLYIFAWLSPIPEDIYWESTRVEQVIAEAQEYIMMPEIDVSVSPLVMFNPLNIFRGMRLGKHVMRNEDDASLEEVIPPALYARFSALKTQYFPKNKKIETMRPLVAGAQMVSAIQKEAGLLPAGAVGKRIHRLVKRNRDITVTEIKHEMRLEGGFKDLANRVEKLMDSIPHELELSCFERQLTQMEEGLEEMQYRASTWTAWLWKGSAEPTSLYPCRCAAGFTASAFTSCFPMTAMAQLLRPGIAASPEFVKAIKEYSIIADNYEKTRETC